MLLVGVIAGQIAIGANVLGIRDALTEHFGLVAQALGNNDLVSPPTMQPPNLYTPGKASSGCCRLRSFGHLAQHRHNLALVMV